MTPNNARTPVSVTHIGKYTVTIYDQDAYNASLLQYPDDDNATQSKRNATKPVTHVAFQKKKPASRYNWTTKLETPLKGKV